MKKKMTFNKKREKRIDLGLLILMGLLMALLLYFLYGYFAPNKYFMIVAILAAIFLVFLLALFIRTKNMKILWAKRSIIILLCLGLGIGSYYMGVIDNAARNLGGTNTNEILIIAKKDSSLNEEKDLNDKTVGIQTLTHTNVSTFVQEELDKSEIQNVNYQEGLDFASLYDELQNGTIDAMIIARADFNNLRTLYEDIDSNTKIIATYQMDADLSTSTASDVDITKEVFTVLVSGIGETDLDPNQNGLSDVNILMIIDPVAKHVELVSIPRDSYVPNPQLGYVNDKLTHLSSHGISNLEAGLELALNIDIDFYVKLNFVGTVQLIDAIGGVDVDVPIAFCEQDEYRQFGEHEICLEAGPQHLNGSQAVAFARHRKSYSDIDRGKAQQQVISAAISQVTSLNGVAKIPGLLSILPDVIATNVPYDSMKAFAANEIETAGSSSWSIHSLNFDNWTSDMLETASAPGQALSVTILSMADAANIYNVYYAMKNPQPMKDFTFNVENFDLNKQPFEPYPSMFWVETGYPAYSGGTPAEQYPEEPPEEIPEVPVEEIPEAPATPTIPEESGEETPQEETPVNP